MYFIVYLHFFWYIKDVITLLHEVSSFVFIKFIYLFLCHVFNDALITSFCLLASLYPSKKREREREREREGEREK